jgi:DNA-binding ferritin-like protein (Dps family)
MTIIIETTVEWPSLKPRFETIAASAKASYQKVEPLVRYLESESIRVPAMLLTRSPHQRRNITADYQKMQTTLIELSGFTERSKKMIADGLIDQLEEAKRKYSKFQEILACTEYLADITEDTIYQTYRTAVQGNHSKGFEDFSQHHRDAYLRLKLRDLHYS